MFTPYRRQKRVRRVRMREGESATMHFTVGERLWSSIHNEQQGLHVHPLETRKRMSGLRMREGESATRHLTVG